MHSLEVDRTEIQRYLTPTDADIESKFRTIAVPVLGEAKVAGIVAIAASMDRVANMEMLIKALQP